MTGLLVDNLLKLVSIQYLGFIFKTYPARCKTHTQMGKTHLPTDSQTQHTVFREYLGAQLFNDSLVLRILLFRDLICFGTKCLTQEKTKSNLFSQSHWINHIYKNPIKQEFGYQKYKQNNIQLYCENTLFVPNCKITM